MGIGATQEELNAARGYESLFVPALFAPWVRHVIEVAEISERSHVLDIACGTGVLARHAQAQGGARVVGLDPASGMIALAREIEPDINWVQGNAEALPFEAESFDCVVSQFGLMFFEDRQKAAQEMYRVAKPGGHLAIVTWSAVDQNPAYRDVAALLDAQVSNAAGDAVRVPFCLGDPEEVTVLLAKAGFTEIACEQKVEKARFPNTRTMVEAELRGWLPLFAIHLGEEEITEVLEASDAYLQSHVAPSGEAEFPTSALIFTAHKPH